MLRIILSTVLIFLVNCNTIKASSSNAIQLITDHDAILIAQKYLNIQNIKKYDVIVRQEKVTDDSYNTYRELRKGTSIECWIVTFVVPDAVGASRTVYVSKGNGEVMGGYSSK